MKEWNNEKWIHPSIHPSRAYASSRVDCNQQGKNLFHHHLVPYTISAVALKPNCSKGIHLPQRLWAYDFPFYVCKYLFGIWLWFQVTVCIQNDLDLFVWMGSPSTRYLYPWWRRFRKKYLILLGFESRNHSTSKKTSLKLIRSEGVDTCGPTLLHEFL